MGHDPAREIPEKMSEAGTGQPVLKGKDGSENAVQDSSSKGQAGVSDMGRKMSEAGSGSPPLQTPRK